MKYLKLFEDFESEDDVSRFLESLTKHVKNYDDVWYSKLGGGGSRRNVTYPWTYYLRNGEMVMGHSDNHFPDNLYVDPKIKHLTDNPNFLDSFNALFGENKKKKIVMDQKKWEKMKNQFSVFPDDLGTLMKESEDMSESKTNVDKALKNKSEDSGIPVGILKKVYSKGMQAWNAGHRPGVAQHQWGMGRVNSFITGSGGARKADADLWKKAKAAKDRKKKKK